MPIVCYAANSSSRRLQPWSDKIAPPRSVVTLYSSSLQSGVEGYYKAVRLQEIHELKHSMPVPSKQSTHCHSKLLVDLSQPFTDSAKYIFDLLLPRQIRASKQLRMPPSFDESVHLIRKPLPSNTVYIPVLLFTCRLTSCQPFFHFEGLLTQPVVLRGDEVDMAWKGCWISIN